MPVAVDIHLPGVTAETYARMIAAIGPRLVSAPGFLSHAAGPDEGGFRVLEVWRSEAEWARFVEAHVAPLARAAGIEPRPRVQPLERLVTTVDAKASEHAGEAHVAPLATDEGRSFRLGPLEILVKEDGSATRQTLAVAEFRGNAFRIPPHTHTEHDENIYVLEGEMTVRLGERTFVAGAGTSFTIPIGVPHAIWNESGARVRFLNMIAPARYLDYFHEMAAAAGATLPPPDVIARVMRRYGLQPLSA